MGTYPYASGFADGSGWAAAPAGSFIAASRVGIDGQLASYGIDGDGHHNPPSDLTAWVESMLPDLGQIQPPSTSASYQLQASDPAAAATQQQQQQRRMEEEDSGIRVIHLLMSCADALQRGDDASAGTIAEDLRSTLAGIGISSGIGKVAHYFADALFRRLCGVDPPLATKSESEILYHGFYEACPYLKFAHFTANQAILEAFRGHDRVHIIDFNLMQGLQWPALIQALALRPGGPPFLRFTGIGLPSENGRDELREVGLRLAELARSMGVRFAFRGVAAARLDDVQPWMLHVNSGEAVAVNAVMQLHRLLGDQDDTTSSSGHPQPIDVVLDWVVGLRPLVFAVVEQESDHNKPGFLDRFTEALFYYSAVFDSLDATALGNQRRQAAGMAEAYLQREIYNVVCCEGPARSSRHEPLSRWRTRLSTAGLTPVRLGTNAFRQASMLLTLFSGDGYSVDDVDGCLALAWHRRPLIAASAWRVDDTSPSHLPKPVLNNIIKYTNNSNNGINEYYYNNEEIINRSNEVYSNNNEKRSVSVSSSGSNKSSSGDDSNGGPRGGVLLM